MCDDDDGRERARLPFNIAQIWLGLGEAEDRLVVKACPQRGILGTWLGVCPQLDNPLHLRCAELVGQGSNPCDDHGPFRV